ncbi:PAS domain S-box protein [Pseudanabaena sp. PCC 6802]|uniref:PAS domain S-box protein n=1 Tax=Pseudanabaena sp. PCC 6802 TaxID=118173 RepID=UPI00034494C7|nr:PAS domain S-box protein [Pseudanabaena sp. PCC 6802]
MFSDATNLSQLDPKFAIVRDPLIAAPDTKAIAAIAQMHGARSPDANDLLQEVRSSCVLVVEAEQLVGILTDRDVVRLVVEQQPLDTLTIAQVMAPLTIALRESDFTDGAIAMNLLQANRMRHLPVLDERDRPVGLVTRESLQQALNSKDSSDRKCTEFQLETQNALLSKIARDEPLSDVLHELIAFIEHCFKDALGSILLLESDNRLCLGSAPSLPQGFNRAIEDGIAIGEGQGSCGTAAFRRETTIVIDIDTDPLWQEYKELPLAYGLRACWSTPIMASDNRVLGTFAVYYQEVRSPTALELESIGQAANIAGIAIEREQAKRSLQTVGERYSLATRAARVGVWEHNLKTQEVYIDPNIKAFLGYTDADIPNDAKSWLTFTHPDDIELVRSAINTHIDEQTSEFVIEHRMLHRNGSIVWVLVRGMVLRDEHGNPERMLGTDMDISDRKQAEIALNNLIAGTASTTGRDFFTALVNHIAEALNVSYALVTERVGDRLQSLAFWANGSLQPTFSYHPAKTPCERTLEEGIFYCESGVQQLFPEDLDLIAMEAEGYLGIALRNNQGEAIGDLCILDRLPIQDPHRAENLLKVFGARAVAELERQRASTLLEQLNQQLEAKVAERTADLQEQKHFITEVTESSTAILYIYDLVEQRNVYVNCQIQTILGYTPVEVQAMGSNFFPNLIHPDDLPQVMAKLEQYLTSEDGEVMDVEYRMRCVNGEWCWLQSRNRVFKRTVEGLPWQIIGTAVDISDRKAAETALRQSEERYRAIVEDQTELICRFQPDGTLTFVNESYCRYFGASESELIGFNFLNLIPEDEREFVAQSVKALRNLTPENPLHVQEHSVIKTDGQIAWQLWTDRAIFDKDNRLVEFQSVGQDITDLKAAEAEARKQKELLDLFFSQSLDGCFFMMLDRPIDWNESVDKEAVLDYVFAHQRMTRVNSAMLDQYGATSEQLLHLTPNDFFAHNLEQGKRVWRQLFDIGHLHTETEAVKLDGTAMTVEGDYVCMYDREGRIIGHFGIQRDISDRKRAEEQLQQLNQELEIKVQERTARLQEREQFLQTVLDTFPLSVFWKNQASVYLGCNRNFLRDANLNSVEEIVGKTDYELPWGKTEAANAYRADDREVMQSNIAKLGIVETLVRANGNQIWVETNKLPLHNLQGEVVGVLGTYQNISDRKRTEQQLQDSEAKLQAILNGSSSVVYVKDLEGRHTFVNQAFLDFFNCKMPDIIGKNNHDFFPANIADLIRINDRATLAEGHIRQFEEEVKVGYNTYTFLSNKFVLRNRNGYPYAICGISTDISSLKQTDAKLQETHQALLRANRLKDEFLANMSHELRTPLNTILGMTEGLQDGIFGETNPAQIKSLEAIERSGLHLLEVINDILDLAKIESGRMDMEPSSVDVVALCQSSLAFIKKTALDKRIQLELKLPPHLPNILVDERRIRQVLINLLSNAVKFTLAGGRIILEVSHLPQPPTPSREVHRLGLTGEARAAERYPQPQLQIAVTDTGIGIATEDMSKLFQPFTQIDSALNRKYEGTGLGLSLVKRIVELHGGQVGVTSTVGVGTCFTIDLPCTTTVLPSPVQNVPSDTGSKARLFERKFTPLILLAEDNEANTITISSYLRAKGYRILISKNGKEAIALAQSEHPDLILMDIQMPDLDGIEAMQQIRRDPNLANVSIVALTGLAMAGDRDRCLTAGANEYLSKPVKLKQLTQLIQKLLTPSEDNQ